MSNKARKKLPSNGEIVDKERDRLKDKAIDPYYIQAYLDNPKLSQVEVLKLAMIDAGIAGNATRQFAYKVHDRNRSLIDAEMVKLASDLKNLAISVIKELMISADSESVRLSAAQTGTKDLFPNVSIKKEQSIDDIDAMIEQKQAEIAKSECKELH